MSESERVSQISKAIIFPLDVNAQGHGLSHSLLGLCPWQALGESKEPGTVQGLWSLPRQGHGEQLGNFLLFPNLQF